MPEAQDRISITYHEEHLFRGYVKEDARIAKTGDGLKEYVVFSICTNDTSYNQDTWDVELIGELRWRSVFVYDSVGEAFNVAKQIKRGYCVEVRANLDEQSIEGTNSSKLIINAYRVDFSPMQKVVYLQDGTTKNIYKGL